MSTRLCSDGCKTQQSSTGCRDGQWLCDECAKWRQQGFYRLKDDNDTVTVEPAEGNTRHVTISMDESFGSSYDDQNVVMCLSPDEAQDMARKLLQAAIVTRALIARQSEASRKAREGTKCDPLMPPSPMTFRMQYFSSSTRGQQCNHAFKG